MSEIFHTLLPGNETIEPQRYAGASRIVRVNRDRRDFLAGLPVKESESVQLGPGTGEYLSRRISGRDLIILSYRMAPKLAVHTVPKMDWLILLMALNRRSEFVFNGRAARPFDLFLSAGRDGYMTTGKDRVNIAIGIRKTRLISACAALAGVGAEDVALRDLVLPPEQDTGQRLRRMLIGAATPSEDEPLSQGQFALPQALENDLTSMLAAQLVPAVRSVPEVNLFQVDALCVVRAATAASKALPAASLADLCGAAGVSQRWLHKCFVDVLGVSPYRYIRLARLSRARELLLNPDAKPALVKSISLSLGYRLSGRFAADYRSVFGENPSDTL
jgi:AraC-like DNA-binding protein